MADIDIAALLLVGSKKKQSQKAATEPVKPQTKKTGRPLVGNAPMTAAERMRRMRARKKELG